MDNVRLLKPDRLESQDPAGFVFIVANELGAVPGPLRGYVPGVHRPYLEDLPSSGVTYLHQVSIPRRYMEHLDHKVHQLLPRVSIIRILESVRQGMVPHGLHPSLSLLPGYQGSLRQAHGQNPKARLDYPVLGTVPHPAYPLIVFLQPVIQGQGSAGVRSSPPAQVRDCRFPAESQGVHNLLAERIGGAFYHT